MNDIKEEEYLYITGGTLLSEYMWGIYLTSSDQSVDALSFILADNVCPPYASHKFNREEVIKIRDYLNSYLHRTAHNNE